MSNITIEFTLETVNLSDNPRYEALSYVWRADRTRPVKVHNEYVLIRENLWQTLYHPRKSKAKRTLWIDGLCINQKDRMERNKQVAQMGRIYQSADLVVAWLGMPDLSSMSSDLVLLCGEAQISWNAFFAVSRCY